MSTTALKPTSNGIGRPAAIVVGPRWSGNSLAPCQVSTQCVTVTKNNPTPTACHGDCTTMRQRYVPLKSRPRQRADKATSVAGVSGGFFLKSARTLPKRGMGHSPQIGASRLSSCNRGRQVGISGSIASSNRRLAAGASSRTFRGQIVVGRASAFLEAIRQVIIARRLWKC